MRDINDVLPSHIYLNATAAAAAQSSDTLIPLVRIPTSGGNIDSSTGATSIHFEYAPTVEQTGQIKNLN